MKNIYLILSLCLIFTSSAIFGQSKIYAPSLNSPEDMELGQMPDVLLDWDAVTGIALEIDYEVQLANNANFDNAQTFPKTDLTAMAMSNLMFGGTYYWRVRAYDGDIVSDWSEAWSFTVAWAIRMKSPNDAAEVYVNPEITWYPLTGLDGYELQLDTVYAWSKVQTGVDVDIFGAEIVDNANMWAVGEGGTVLFGDGASWTQVDIGTSENLNAVSFVDANNGYIVGDGGTVVQFDGTSWTTIDIGTTKDLKGISFVDADNGVVVGAGGTIVVYNAGTWTPVTSVVSSDLTGVTMLSSSNIWACGKSKKVLNYNGTDWTVEEVGTKDHNAIHMVDANSGWVVSKSGKINYWNGFFWEDQASGITKTLNGVSYSNGVAYAVGDDGYMVMFNGRWNLVTSGISEDLFCVTLAPGNGLIGGAKGEMMQETDTGFNSPYLSDIVFSGDSTMWVFDNLLFGQTFYYRLRGFHGADTSQWSGVKSFTTYPSPELESPGDASTTDLSIKFMWDKYKGSTSYIIEVDTDPNFSDPSAHESETDTARLEFTSFGTEYFWRVAAQHIEDISDWSEAWSFTTVNAVSLTAPENEAVEVKLCPLFTWEDIEGPVSYELWIDTDQNFSDPRIYVGDKPQYQCQTTMEYNTLYYWKVRGVAGVHISEWSDTWSYRTQQGIGIEEELDVNSMRIYPNPNNGIFSIDINSTVNSEYTLKVVDIAGKMIFDRNINVVAGQNTLDINIDNIESGSYNIIITNGENSFTKHLVIN